jgi:apolipoprotein N-acyltransferase
MASQSIWGRRGWGYGLIIMLIGASAVFGFAPFHLWGVTLAALICLFVRFNAVSTGPRPLRTGFLTGFLFGLGWFSSSCFWIASAFIERGPEFIPMIPPLVGGLALILAFFWGVAGLFIGWVAHKGRTVLTGLAFTASLSLAELARGHLLSGFPWNLPGYTFAPGGSISQVAHLFGIYGLTTLLFLIASLIGVSISHKKIGPAIGGLFILIGCFSYGQGRLSNTSQDVQPNVMLRLIAMPFRQSEKINPQTAALITDEHLRLSLSPGLDRVTHLVWPEGAVNGLATENQGFLNFVGYHLAAETDRPPVWLMNSLRQEIKPDRAGRPKTYYYNSAVAVTFDAAGTPAIVGVNDKKKLVPFGEFIPGGALIERLGGKLVSTALASITPAREKTVANFPGLPPLSPQICYEVIFPGLTPRVSAKDGAAKPEFILNQSNDAWFGNTVGPAQHAAIARYRAIEEGLPLVRSAANGVSGVFDAYGRAEAVLDGKSPDFIDTVLPRPVAPGLSLRSVNAALSLINVLILLVTASLTSNVTRKIRRAGQYGFK